MHCMALVLLISPFNVSAQDLESVEPFKVGTAIDDVPTVGLVLLDDQLIVELEAKTARWNCTTIQQPGHAGRHAWPHRTI